MGRQPAGPGRLTLVAFDGDPTPAEGYERGAGHASPEMVDSRRATGDRWLFAVIGLLAGVALVLGAVLLWPADDPALTTADVDAAVAQALAGQAQPVAATDAYEQASPSIVGVKAIRDGEEPTIGTGVVINDQGQIVTANHVVFGADQIEVQFHDGSVSQARLVTNEAPLDIAVLSSDERPGTAWPAVLGNSRTLQIGDPVYAVGNPLGLSNSISAGIISGLGRNIPFPGDDAVFEDLIQFDAAVNQGSSGGPLLNADGHVVGIVTALADPAGQGFFIGIGFAVPIDIAAGGAADGPSQ